MRKDRGSTENPSFGHLLGHALGLHGPPTPFQAGSGSIPGSQIKRSESWRRRTVPQQSASGRRETRHKPVLIGMLWMSFMQTRAILALSSQNGHQPAVLLDRWYVNQVGGRPRWRPRYLGKRSRLLSGFSPLPPSPQQPLAISVPAPRTRPSEVCAPTHAPDPASASSSVPQAVRTVSPVLIQRSSQASPILHLQYTSIFFKN